MISTKLQGGLPTNETTIIHTTTFINVPRE
jgi:hypothetical protein